MSIKLREYVEEDVKSICTIWNQIINDQDGFLWVDEFPYGKLEYVLSQQSAVVCAVNEENDIVGFYTLRSNQSGRGNHVANGLFAVKKEYRGKGFGKILGEHAKSKAKELGFEAIQFNSVIASNTASVRLWENLGFSKVGFIKKGYKVKERVYDDLYIYHLEL